MGSIMRKAVYTVAAMAFVAGAAGAANAQVDQSNDPRLQDRVVGDKRTGITYATEETIQMNLDDFTNPAMVWVDAAAETWATADGEAGKSCQDCHGDVSSMKGVKVKYPMIDDANPGKLINLELRINRCRTDNMKAKAWKYESDDMLGMTGLIGYQSRGMAVQSRAGDPKYAKFMEQGKTFYYTRRGQLDLACKHCHEDNSGNLIRAETLSQGQTNGFPTYRLKWQKPGSLHRRFRGCNGNIRAAKLPYGSDEYLALELYLNERGAGLPVETPSVRK